MTLIERVYASTQPLERLRAHEIVTEILNDWYVECSVTGDLIPFHDLKYWDVDSNMIFKDAATAFKHTN